MKIPYKFKHKKITKMLLKLQISKKLSIPTKWLHNYGFLLAFSVKVRNNRVSEKESKKKEQKLSLLRHIVIFFRSYKAFLMTTV